MSQQSDMLAALLAAPPEAQTRYPPNSRYHGLPARSRTLPDGRLVTHLVPRVLPDPARMTLLAVHAVRPLDRCDKLAAAYLGDPLLDWRIADANSHGILDDLTGEPGRRLRIAVSEGRGGT